MMVWDDSEEDGNVRSVRKMKALTVKMETVTVNRKLLMMGIIMSETC